ncbi:Superoxide-generating NADPH oxidase heavy chain subunit B [Micractinium conductrix]|uniref:Superoxide-generating NADPH oxidase heavy chain subunit B n=1 Tax=Micractinium conductrix TaxID=554055 RepID=A0A2P6VJK5_9CHLO|nr:Superoxide-generating NADPH oxidase heavy chain subunit B [Micractinium conductrix]|eukprot:PSC74273.1 Superoxide-generating NADPH oxidase heavy chain subunit B [Micractinium conductrix]
MSQGGCRPLAATLARALLKLAAAASLAFFYVYVGFAWLPSDFYTDFGFIYDNWGIPYPYGMPRAFKRLSCVVGRVLAWEAPPRRFWAWWCGGMSVLDLTVLALVFAYNAWYFAYYYMQYDRLLDAVAECGLAYPEPRWRLMTEKWIGHVTLWVVSLHGWLYYLYWALKQAFWVNFSNWGTLSSINYLAGSMAYLFALLLWSSSLGWVRRRFFEVFYRCHLVGFVGFTLFSYMHYLWGWTMFLPSLLLYAADLALRAGQLTNTTLVTAAAVDDEAGMGTVQLRTSQASRLGDVIARAMKGCPVHELFLLVPSISRWQWHPITVAGTAPDTQGKWEGLAACARLQAGVTCPGSVLTLSIKRYGRWTKAGLPSRVHLVWAARQPREFCILDADLLAAALSNDGWLKIELYCTGPSAAIDGPKLEPSASSASSGSDELKPQPSFDQKGSPKSSPSRVPSAATVTAAATPAPHASALASPFFHKVARVVQPQAVGAWHLAAVYLLVWLGAFLGTYLGAASPTSLPYPRLLQVGMVWFFAQAVMSIGVPYALAVLPVHMWRQPGSGEALPLAPPQEPSGHGSGCRLVGNTLTACGEVGLQVAPGRPSLRDTLLSARKQASPGSTLGVFVGGPEPLTREAHLQVAALNDAGCCRAGSKGAHFELHAMTHTL